MSHPYFSPSVLGTHGTVDVPASKLQLIRWRRHRQSIHTTRCTCSTLVLSSKYFGTRKCCHPQISDLVIRLVFFRESSRKIINKLTSRLPSCESSIPGRFALFECNSNDVRICKKISQESCHQEIMKPKSDIWGWQHLWGPKDLLKLTLCPLQAAQVSYTPTRTRRRSGRTLSPSSCSSSAGTAGRCERRGWSMRYHLKIHISIKK